MKHPQIKRKTRKRPEVISIQLVIFFEAETEAQKLRDSSFTASEFEWEGNKCDGVKEEQRQKKEDYLSSWIFINKSFCAPTEAIPISCRSSFESR